MQSKKNPSICKSDWLQTMAMQIMAIQNGKKKIPDGTGWMILARFWFQILQFPKRQQTKKNTVNV